MLNKAKIELAGTQAVGDLNQGAMIQSIKPQSEVLEAATLEETKTEDV
jgi:hypothetical protein